MGTKSFALILEGRVVMKLERWRQDLLFEVRPETFQRCPVATGYWSFVDIGRLDLAELEALLTEAWTQIVPKKVSRPYLAKRSTG